MVAGIKGLGEQGKCLVDVDLADKRRKRGRNGASDEAWSFPKAVSWFLKRP